jgi:hypothetical protein
MGRSPALLATCLGSWYINVNCDGNVKSFGVLGTWFRLMRVIFCSLVNYVDNVKSFLCTWDVVPFNESNIVFPRKLRRQSKMIFVYLGRGPV